MQHTMQTRDFTEYKQVWHYLLYLRGQALQSVPCSANWKTQIKMLSIHRNVNYQKQNAVQLKTVKTTVFAKSQQTKILGLQ